MSVACVMVEKDMAEAKTRDAQTTKFLCKGYIYVYPKPALWLCSSQIDINLTVFA